VRNCVLEAWAYNINVCERGVFLAGSGIMLGVGGHVSKVPTDLIDPRLFYQLDPKFYQPSYIPDCVLAGARGT